MIQENCKFAYLSLKQITKTRNRRVLRAGIQNLIFKNLQTAWYHALENVRSYNLYGYILLKSQAQLLLAANCKARRKLCRQWR